MRRKKKQQHVHSQHNIIMKGNTPEITWSEIATNICNESENPSCDAALARRNNKKKNIYKKKLWSNHWIVYILIVLIVVSGQCVIRGLLAIQVDCSGHLLSKMCSMFTNHYILLEFLLHFSTNSMSVARRIFSYLFLRIDYFLLISFLSIFFSSCYWHRYTVSFFVSLCFIYFYFFFDCSLIANWKTKDMDAHMKVMNFNLINMCTSYQIFSINDVHVNRICMTVDRYLKMKWIKISETCFKLVELLAKPKKLNYQWKTIENWIKLITNINQAYFFCCACFSSLNEVKSLLFSFVTMKGITVIILTNKHSGIAVIVLIEETMLMES